MQDFAFSLVELHEIPLSLNPQPVQVSPKGSTAIWSICLATPFQFCIIHKHTEGALCPSIQVINEEYWSL